MKHILNVGCGETTYGTIRTDIYPSSTVNVMADASALPFESGTFDEVYTRFVFEHLANPLATMLEWRRVLKPGGQITIITDNASYWRWHVRLPGLPSTHVDYRGVSENDRHMALYMPMHIRNIFEAAGLEVENIALEGLYPTSIPLFVIGLKSLAYASIRAIARRPSVEAIRD